MSGEEPQLPAGAELLAQGAEARVFACDFHGRAAVIKERFAKTYRHPVLDRRLTRGRQLAEVRCIVRLHRAGVRTPAILFVDPSGSRIVFERVPGDTAKAFIRARGSAHPESMAVASAMGALVAQMHNADVSHGDLTTSNALVVVQEGGELSLVVIDLGLATMGPSIEEKAVDLYVMERAFTSSHPDSEELVAQALRIYKQESRRGDMVLQRLAAVRARGRKRSMFG